MDDALVPHYLRFAAALTLVGALVVSCWLLVFKLVLVKFKFFRELPELLFGSAAHTQQAAKPSRLGSRESARPSKRD